MKGIEFSDYINNMNQEFLHLKNSILLFMGVITTKLDKTIYVFDENMYTQITLKERDSQLQNKTQKKNIFRYHRLYKLYLEKLKK